MENDKAITIKPLLNSFRGERFDAMMQQDVHEFREIIFNLLKEELNKNAQIDFISSFYEGTYKFKFIYDHSSAF